MFDDPEFQRNLQQRVAQFVDALVQEILSRVAKEMRDTMSSALAGFIDGATAAPAQSNGASRKAAKVAAAKAPAPTAPAPKKRNGAIKPVKRKGAHRSPDEIDALGRQFAAYIRKHPGSGMTEISRALGTQSADLARPKDLLVQRGAIRTEGERVHTRYYVVEAASDA